MSPAQKRRAHYDAAVTSASNAEGLRASVQEGLKTEETLDVELVVEVIKAEALSSIANSLVVLASRAVHDR